MKYKVIARLTNRVLDIYLFNCSHYEQNNKELDFLSHTDLVIISLKKLNLKNSTSLYKCQVYMGE